MLKITVQNTCSHVSERQVKRVTGFTLIELMISIAVAVIVTTVAIPNFMSLVNSNRLSSQANDFLSAIMLARAEAIKQNENIVFCHSTDGATCSAPPSAGWVGWLVHDTVDNVTIATGFVRSEKIVVLSSANVASAIMNGTGHSIRFSPQGLVRSGNTNNPLNGVLRVCLPGTGLQQNAKDIELRSGGRSRISSRSSAVCPAPSDPI